jgi:hypothetical protein
VLLDNLQTFAWFSRLTLHSKTRGISTTGLRNDAARQHQHQDLSQAM